MPPVSGRHPLALIVILPDPRIDSLLIVLIFVPETKVSCFPEISWCVVKYPASFVKALMFVGIVGIVGLSVKSSYDPLKSDLLFQFVISLDVIPLATEAEKIGSVSVVIKPLVSGRVTDKVKVPFE